MAYTYPPTIYLFTPPWCIQWTLYKKFMNRKGKEEKLISKSTLIVVIYLYKNHQIYRHNNEKTIRKKGMKIFLFVCVLCCIFNEKLLCRYGSLYMCFNVMYISFLRIIFSVENSVCRSYSRWKGVCNTKLIQCGAILIKRS